MDQLSLMLAHAKGSPAEEHIQTIIDKMGYWAPEIKRQMVLEGGSGFKGLFEICVTWFPDDKEMKLLYQKVYNTLKSE